MKHRNIRKPQRSPDRTTLWYVGLNYRKVYVAKTGNKLPKTCNHIQRIRSITPQAAARRYIRNTLPGLYLSLDDVYFWTPGEIVAAMTSKSPMTYERALKRDQQNAKKDAKNTEFVVIK
jgi:hypothetical protein